MKTYLADIIPKIKQYSEKLDNLTMLINQHWVVLNELENSKFVYIFRNNNELLTSKNGKVEKGKWEYLGNNSLLIELKNECYLFKHGFFDANILALKVDGTEEFAFLINENKYSEYLYSIEKVLLHLENKYLRMVTQPKIQIPPKFRVNSHVVELKNKKQFRIVAIENNIFVCSPNGGLINEYFYEYEIELFSIWVEDYKKKK